MPHKLLLADDSVTIQRVIELTFADEDVQVLTAGDGEQAIQSIQAERPDIVLADIAMPKRTGYDVAAFIRGVPELSHIPVLLLTGAFEPVDERQARAAGCDGVLVKPFEPQYVIARVRELLGNRSRGAMPADGPAPAGSAPARPPQDGTGVGLVRAAESSLDDYFDRLDAAFATIAAPEGAPRREGPVMEQDLDWFDRPSPQADAGHRMEPRPSPAAPADDTAPPHAEPPGAPGRVIDVPPAAAVDPVPVTFANPPRTPAWPLPQPPSIEPPDSPPERAPEPSRHTPAPAPVTDIGSAIADAFSALLAVEQGEPGATATPARYALAAEPHVSDELVDAVARRVIERIGPQIAQDIVADVVSRLAERLVREEIARIRGRRPEDSAL